MMNAYVVDLPRFLDKRVNLSFAEEFKQIPFKLARSYWIYDVPGGEACGGHAYKENQEFIIALSGSFDVLLDDGTEKKIFTLNRSYYGLYVPGGIWREMSNFQPIRWHWYWPLHHTMKLTIFMITNYLKVISNERK